MKNILNESVLKNIPNKSGVYKIYAYDYSKKPIPINRFSKIDKTGLLYIGRSANLKKRLYQFLSSSNRDMKTHNHSAGCKYNKIEIITKILNKHHLYFEYFICENYKEFEKKLLKKYIDKFGEQPVLNK